MTRLTTRIRQKIRWSMLYTFDCVQAPLDPQHGLESPGYSRIVHCNNPELHHRPPLNYATNYISTTKYTLITFLPKALFEQFRRVANLYFLLIAICSFLSVSPKKPMTVVLPLMIVVGFSLVKDGLEDWRRFKQDLKVNRRKVSVHNGDGSFVERSWKDVRVGDVIKVVKDQFFPADLVFLSSSYEDGICYVETMNLDGETNLKVKRTLEATLMFEDDTAFKDCNVTVKCESPNASLYTFSGNFELDHQVFPLDPNQILLRDSKLRNTSYIYGVVIFTGHESKVMQNSTDSPSKRSTIERSMDRIIVFLFSLLFSISVVSSTSFAVIIAREAPLWWYLQPQKTDDSFNPSDSAKSGLVHLVTALMFYDYLLPISLYVSIEFVKLTQAKFINKDLQMYDEETGIAARARTSNLNEELGQVDTILTDKTGTLTCNQMDFLKCSIAGVSYGIRCSEVELAAAKEMKARSEEWDKSVPGKTNRGLKTAAVKGFSFEDERLMQGNWMKQPNPDEFLMFFRILALCHTAIPEVDEQGGYTYEAESPDEGAFLVAAREFGFEFCRRTQSSVFVRERYPFLNKLLLSPSYSGISVNRIDVNSACS